MDRLGAVTATYVANAPPLRRSARDVHFLHHAPSQSSVADMVATGSALHAQPQSAIKPFATLWALRLALQATTLGTARPSKSIKRRFTASQWR